MVRCVKCCAQASRASTTVLKCVYRHAIQLNCKTFTPNTMISTTSRAAESTARTHAPLGLDCKSMERRRVAALLRGILTRPSRSRWSPKQQKMQFQVLRTNLSFARHGSKATE